MKSFQITCNECKSNAVSINLDFSKYGTEFLQIFCQDCGNWYRKNIAIYPEDDNILTESDNNDRDK